GARGNRLATRVGHHAQPYRDAPAASGPARGSGRTRAPGWVAGRCGPPAVRLRPSRGPDPAAARRGRTPGERADSGGPAGAGAVDELRRGHPARRHGAVWRKIWGPGPRDQHRRVQPRAVRGDAPVAVWAAWG